MTECIRRQHSYWTTCRCPDCTIDRRRKRKLQSLGHTNTPAAERAWQLLCARFDQGWTARAVGSATGLGPGYFSRHIAAWRRGETTRLGPAVSRAILNMGTPTDGQVGAEPSRRQLQALAAIGHGLNTLAAETGIGFSTLAAIRTTCERVSAGIANTITQAYERLEETPGDDTQAQRIARDKGWHAPRAWDDITDHNETPGDTSYKPPLAVNDMRNAADYDENVVLRILAGDYRLQATTAERREVVQRWRKSDPMAGHRGYSREDPDKPSMAYLARLTGWKIERYIDRQDGAA